MTPRHFVGREPLLARLEAAVRSGSGGAIRVSGPVGIGKTYLLRKLTDLLEPQIPVRWLDSSTEVGPAAILAVAGELERERAAGAGSAAVLILDDLYLARAHERWLVSTFLPSRPTLTVIICDRLGPSAIWLAAPDRAQELSLAPFSEAETGRYLEARGIAASRRAEIASLAEGNPLLLSLACDVVEGKFGDLKGTDVLLALAERLCLECDSPERRLGFAAVLVSRGTPFELLEEVLGPDGGVPVFRWLRTLSVIEDTPLGLRPHSVVRKACGECMKAHHPASLLAALRGARRYCDRMMLIAPDPLRWVLDRLYLDRELSAMQPYLAAPYDDDWLVDRAVHEDGATIVRLARASEGELVADHVQNAFRDGPQQFDVLRDTGGQVVGFLLTAELGRADPSWRARPADQHPALSLIRAYLERIGWFSSDDPAHARVLAYLHWTVAETHQKPSGGANLLLAQMTRRLLLVPSLAFHFSVTTEPERWLALIRFLGFQHEVAGSFQIDGTRYTVIANDWRQVSMAEFLARASEASLAAGVAREQAKDAGRDGASDLGSLLRERLDQMSAQVGISVREREVLDLLVLGRSSQEIADALGVSARTAKFHQRNVLEKMGADSRLDILRLLL